MSAKKSAEVIIDGKVYTVSGYEEEGYLQKVASYINNKLAEFGALEEFRKLPLDTRTTLIYLNMADDYFKAKSAVETSEHSVEQKEKDIYDLKHDLVSDQIHIEDLERKIARLELENRELLMQKSKLEASLEDALLGGM